MTRYIQGDEQSCSLSLSRAGGFRVEEENTSGIIWNIQIFSYSPRWKFTTGKKFRRNKCAQYWHSGIVPREREKEAGERNESCYLTHFACSWHKKKKEETRKEEFRNPFETKNFNYNATSLGEGGGVRGGRRVFSLKSWERRGGRGLMRPLHKLPSVDVISRPVICDPQRDRARFSSAPVFIFPLSLPPPPHIFSWPHPTLPPSPSLSDRKSYEIYPPDRDPCACPALLLLANLI